jgi:Ser/Thr protein kinase RdoA (MazF antagonist)
MALLGSRYGAQGGLTPFYEDPEAATYRVDRISGPPWVVRIFSQTRPLERVRGDGTVLQYLERQGFPAERVVRAIDGSIATDLNGHGVLVTTFVAGEPPGRDRDSLRQLGEALGRLHTLRTPLGEPDLRRRASALPKDDLAFGRNALDRVASVVPTLRRAEYDDIRLALGQTSDCEDLPTGLTWSDCHLANAVRGADGLITLIDLEGAGQGPLLPALGWLLYSCVVQGPDGPPVPTDLDRVRPILDGYLRYRALTAAEIARLADAVRVRPLVVAARELAGEIERDAPAQRSRWWSRFSEAPAVAHAVRVLITGPQ